MSIWWSGLFFFYSFWFAFIHRESASEPIEFLIHKFPFSCIFQITDGQTERERGDEGISWKYITNRDLSLLFLYIESLYSTTTTRHPLWYIAPFVSFFVPFSLSFLLFYFQTHKSSKCEWDCWFSSHLFHNRNFYILLPYIFYQKKISSFRVVVVGQLLSITSRRKKKWEDLFSAAGHHHLNPVYFTIHSTIICFFISGRLVFFYYSTFEGNEKSQQKNFDLKKKELRARVI